MNTMNNRVTGPLPIYARLLADDVGVELRFGGRVPQTNGRCITIPATDSNNPKAHQVSLGHVFREAGRIAETTFGLSVAAAADKFSKVLEDVRVEAKRCRQFAGGAALLRDMVDVLITDGYFAAPSAEQSPGALMRSYMLYRLRSEVLGQKQLADYAQRAEELLSRVIPRSTLTRLTALMFRIEDARDTADSILLANSIVQMLEKEAEDPESPQDPGPGDDAEAGKPGDGAADAPDPDSPPSAGDETGGAADNEGDQQSGDKGSSKSGAPDASDADDQSDALRDNVRQIAKGDDNDGPGDVGDFLSDALGKLASDAGSPVTMAPAEIRNDGVGDSASILARVSAETRALKARVVRLFESKRQDDIRFATSGRRLRVDRLIGIANGNLRVFEKRTEAAGQNTAVMLLADRSSSMSQSIVENGRKTAIKKVDVAMDATLAAYAGLSGIEGLRVGAAAFPARVGGTKDGVWELASMGESPRCAARRFMQTGSDGMTPMAQAMLWAGYRLMQCGEDRKILLVSNDGDPDSKQAAIDVIDQLRSIGIEVYALGIGSDPSSVFGADNCRIINNVMQMPAALFSMLQEKLLQAA